MWKLVKFSSSVVVTALALLLSFWFARPDDLSLEEMTPPIPFHEYSHLATVEHVRVHYQEKGKGPPLVLIHGFASSTFTWKDVFEALSGRFRVIALDLKGFGFSEKTAGDYSIEAQADLVTSLLQQLAVQRATLCGHSMGGAVALLSALNDPELIERLILVDGAAYTDVGRRARVVPPFMLKPLLGPVLAALALTSKDVVKSGLLRSFYDQSLVTPERLETYYRPLRTRGGQRAALAVARQWNLSKVENNLHHIKQPTLILWGAEDKLISLKDGQRLHRQIRGSRLIVFRKCGHMPQVELPRQFVTQVATFMTKH